MNETLEHPWTTHPITGVRVGAFRVPTDSPEFDGTLEWDATTLVVVKIEAGGEGGLGYSDADAGVAGLIGRELKEVLSGCLRRRSRDCGARSLRVSYDRAGCALAGAAVAVRRLAGLRFLRERVPPQLEIAEGEHGYDLAYFRRLLLADAADVVMPDVTRCGGITGFRKVATLCETWMLPMSTHCAPALHTHLGCALAPVRQVEYFHDHARIEQDLFEGAAAPRGGVLRPDLSRPGPGLAFKWSDAERYAI